MHMRVKRAFGALLAVGAVLVAAGAVGSASSSVVPSSAKEVVNVPSTVSDTASGGMRGDAPVPTCGTPTGVNWYTVRAPHRGAMVAKLVAHGELDGAVAVYRIVRSQRMPLLCVATNRHGRARVAWYAYTEGSYLIGVVRRQGSAVDTFALSVLASEPVESAPGQALPVKGVRSTINGVLDTMDAYSVPMVRGTTYRLNLTTPSSRGCIGYSIYRPNVPSFLHAQPVAALACGGYSEFTPGLDGGGLYSVVVTTDRRDALDHSYRLEVGPAGIDDTAPGMKIENGQYMTGSLFGHGLDVLDMYRFGVPRDNELTTLELRQKANVGFALHVMDETGRRVGAIREAHGLQSLRLHLPSGRYYAVVRSVDKSGGDYGLQLRVRDVTSTSISAGGTTFYEAPPNVAMPITVHVTQASHGGRVIVEFDHFDPIAGWHFATELTGNVDASGTYSTFWVPPNVGHFRARARFVANPYSSFSESGYVRMHVIEPLE